MQLLMKKLCDIGNTEKVSKKKKTVKSIFKFHNVKLPSAVSLLTSLPLETSNISDLTIKKGLCHTCQSVHMGAFTRWTILCFYPEILSSTSNRIPAFLNAGIPHRK